MKIPRLKTIKIKEKIKKLPRLLAENSFFTFLGLFLFALILGGILFYKYGFLAKRMMPEISEKPLHFEEKVYQEILKIWDEKEKRLKESESKEYRDPFRP